MVIDLEIDGFSATQRTIIEKFRFARGWGIRLLLKSGSPCIVKEEETDLSPLLHLQGPVLLLRSGHGKVS